MYQTLHKNVLQILLQPVDVMQTCVGNNSYSACLF